MSFFKDLSLSAATLRDTANGIVPGISSGSTGYVNYDWAWQGEGRGRGG